MHVLKNLREKLSGGANRLQGRTDLLEAVCASAALVAVADGEIEDEEIEATTKAVSANEVLTVSFDARTIEACIQRMLERAQGGRVGQMGLYKEITDVASNTEDAELVMLTAIDIAEADGEIEPEERVVMDKIGSKLGLKVDNYL